MEINYLGEGYRSITYKNEKSIILKGKNEDAYISYKKDYNVLNFLEGKIDATNIPSNVKLIEKSVGYPYGGLQYDIVDGNVFSFDRIEKYDLDNITSELALFLNQLHGLSVEYNKKLIVDEEKELVQENLTLLKNYFSEEIYRSILHWQEIYYKKLETYNKFCLIHGDFWYENFIISSDGKQLNGVIDFERAGVFMPEYDFASLLYLGDNFIEKVKRNYKLKIDEKLVYLLFVRREICSFKYILKNEPTDAEEAVWKIKQALSLL